MTTQQEHPNDRLARQTMAASTQEFLHDAGVSTEARGPMAELWAIALLVEHGLVQVGEAVRACRADGATDADIAGVLGVTRQAVSQRWVRIGAPVTQRTAGQRAVQPELPTT